MYPLPFSFFSFLNKKRKSYIEIPRKKINKKSKNRHNSNRTKKGGRKMKKITIKLALLITAFLFIFSLNSFAASLDALDITLSKEKIAPGEEITVYVNFGKNLGSYTFDFAYDNNLLEYVSSEGKTSDNDNGTRVRVYYYDATAGSQPRNNMSITFRAKSNLITTNPTDISITAEGLANSDASEEYDDITIPIVKDVTIEPKFEDYQINLSYTGPIVAKQEKDMRITITSNLGKNYDHVRLLANATTPDGGSVELIAKDNQSLDHDIILSGWGDPSGFMIGGQNVNKVIDTSAVFNKAGNYSITFQLVDRDSADAVIASKKFDFTVTEENVTPPETTNPEEENPNMPQEEEAIKEETQKPITSLPKAGYNQYLIMGMISVIIITSYFVVRKKRK